MAFCVLLVVKYITYYGRLELLMNESSQFTFNKPCIVACLLCSCVDNGNFAAKIYACCRRPDRLTPIPVISSLFHNVNVGNRFLGAPSENCPLKTADPALTWHFCRDLTCKRVGLYRREWDCGTNAVSWSHIFKS